MSELLLLSPLRGRDFLLLFFRLIPLSGMGTFFFLLIPWRVGSFVFFFLLIPWRVGSFVFLLIPWRVGSFVFLLTPCGVVTSSSWGWGTYSVSCSSRAGCHIRCLLCIPREYLPCSPLFRVAHPFVAVPTSIYQIIFSLSSHRSFDLPFLRFPPPSASHALFVFLFPPVLRAHLILCSSTFLYMCFLVPTSSLNSFIFLLSSRLIYSSDPGFSVPSSSSSPFLTRWRQRPEFLISRMFCPGHPPG